MKDKVYEDYVTAIAIISRMEWLPPQFRMRAIATVVDIMHRKETERENEFKLTPVDGVVGRDYSKVN